MHDAGLSSGVNGVKMITLQHVNLEEKVIPVDAMPKVQILLSKSHETSGELET